MEEAGGENDANSECLDDDKNIIFGSKGWDTPTQNGDEDADGPAARMEKMAAILRPWVKDLSWRAEDSLEERWKRPRIEMRVNLSNILRI